MNIIALITLLGSFAIALQAPFRGPLPCDRGVGEEELAEVHERLQTMLQSVLYAIRGSDALTLLSSYQQKLLNAANNAEKLGDKEMIKEWLEVVKLFVDWGGRGGQIAAFLMVPVVARAQDDLSILSQVWSNPKDVQVFEREVQVLRRRYVCDEIFHGGDINRTAYSEVVRYYSVITRMEDKKTPSFKELVRRLVPDLEDETIDSSSQ